MYTGPMAYTFLWLVLHLRQQKGQELQKDTRQWYFSMFLSVLRPWVKEDQSRVHFYVALNYRFGSPAYFWWGGGRNNPSTERWGKEARQTKGVILSPVPVGMIEMPGWYMMGYLDIYCIRENDWFYPSTVSRFGVGVLIWSFMVRFTRSVMNAGEQASLHTARPSWSAE